jgi:hypothetical protein
VGSVILLRDYAGFSREISAIKKANNKHRRNLTPTQKTQKIKTQKIKTKASLTNQPHHDNTHTNKIKATSKNIFPDKN